MGEARRPTFYVKKWLDAEEFRELLEVADYLGRTPSSGSVFVLNPSKIAERGYDEEYVGELIRRVSPGISEKELEDIKRFVRDRLSKSSIIVILRTQGSTLVIEPRGYLGNIIDAIKPLLRYDRSRRIFTSYPAYYQRIREYLLSRGIQIDDQTGFARDRHLPIKPSLSIKLREYQEEAVSAWVSNGYKGIVSLPTGSGKTIVGIAAVARKPVWTLVVAFTREQMRQWRDQFIKGCSIPPSIIGLFYSDEKRIAPITISTYQTAFRYIEKLSNHFQMLIVDEVHHLPADKFRAIALGMFSPYRLGLSATVTREDGRHEELFPLMGGIVYHKSPQELVNAGYLSPYRIETIKIDLTPEERKKFEELRKKYRELSRGMEFEELVKAAKSGDELAAEALKVRSELRQLIHNARRKIEKVKEIVSRELQKGSKILIFTQYIDQAETLGKELGAPVITGETEKRVRDKNFQLFREGLERVLVLTTVGDEGIDIPDANVGIIVAGTSSKRQFTQRLGRLLRPKEGKQAVLYEIIAKGTPEELESRKRKEGLEDLFQ
ncbi:MAG: DEAD/DEAH box helicase [Desulfurococcales archaeon]|nr:DEAD/DEAH box helicase [Desulfurococcales archaeon]